MKKIVVFLPLLMLTACVKDWTCNCDASTKYKSTQNESTTTYKQYKDINQKSRSEAMKVCNDYEKELNKTVHSGPSGGYSTYTYTGDCKLVSN